MAKINVKTSKQIVPTIYCYSTPEIARHDGWTKIGYTEQDVDKRLGQQMHTADVKWVKEWQGNATYDDGSGDTFSDKDFHAYLRKQGVEQEKGKNNEWFHINGVDSHNHFYAFRDHRGIVQSGSVVIPYVLRKEQQNAVSQTQVYAQNHVNGEYLWNAKPRFGKTLSVYDLCKNLDANTVLIVTNRPAIANSWYSDYEKFLGKESGYDFVSNTEALKNKPLVLSREEYISLLSIGDDEKHKCIEFVSLQDLKGSIYFGGEHDKLQEVAELNWDILVIDEAHEGVDTYKTDVAFDHITRKFTLHLSGTPFKALANDKFTEDAIYNWTYADEQTAKRDWASDDGSENPYANLPKLNMFTYQMSEIIKDELKQGIDLDGETVEYAFDLNEFFSTKNGTFVHDESVGKFLNAMTTQDKYPFSTVELREELKHTFWILDRVDSAKALAKKLENHPVFSEYRIVLAAGDGRLSEEDESKKAYERVVDAIAQYDKTITLSVGQLTTGITIPEWTAVLMLSNMKSPSLYMQAAFRAQNPCLFHIGTGYFRKENAYVFDFDPARTLVIFEEFANDLSSDTASGRGDMDIRKQHVRELLNFFPVVGEDEEGCMIELDAEKVLSIPRKIRSQEVVRRGFMSNFLFQNISNIFGAPQEILEIIKKLEPLDEPKVQSSLTGDTNAELSLNDQGDVELSDELVIGKTTDVFGEKVFSEISDNLHDVVDNLYEEESEKLVDEPMDRLKDMFKREVVKPLLDTAHDSYGKDLTAAERKRLDRHIMDNSARVIERTYGDYSIQKKQAQNDFDKQIAAAKSEDEVVALTAEYESKTQEIFDSFKESLSSTVDKLTRDAGKEIVKTVEISKREKAKHTIEESIRDHLRGFSRTIPSFLMAYGEDFNVTLENFDTLVPDDVFLEVTSITLEQFRMLRDGGDYVDDETGETKHYHGHLFDSVVFDDSVKEFMRLKKSLANYFDESNTEDIFDYVPPQKNNQIYTPKKMVQQMVSMLEMENPGCFDDPKKTFADLYMKSGLYITEIVKRLYNSDAMKKAIPDDSERIRHILRHQVYGMAPTKIIYKIATNYILGFDDTLRNETKNFVQVDAAEAAQNGTLGKLVNQCFTE